MSSLSRRRFVQSASAASLAFAAGLPGLARAQSPIALRFSSSLVADQNSAHYVWFQQLAANLRTASLGHPYREDTVPSSPSVRYAASNRCLARDPV